MRYRPLARRILRIPVAEEIDRLHVRRVRARLGLEGTARSEGTGGDRMDLGIVEQRCPHPRQAGGLAHHPARTRQRRLLRLGDVLLRCLQQGRPPAGSKRGPARAGLHGCVLFVGNERQAARDRGFPPELPIVRRKRTPILTEEQDICRVPPQQARMKRGRLSRGRIETVETQSRVVAVESVMVRARALLIVGDEPELAVRLLAREMLHAAPKHGPLRRPGARELQRKAGTRVAARAVCPLQGGKQGRCLDLALGQPVHDCGAVGDEFGLPDDAVLAVRLVDPSRIGDEGYVLPDMKGQGTGCVVVEVQPAGDPLAVGNVVLPLVVDFVALAARIGQLAHETRYRRGAQERHVLGAQGNGETIRTEHQVVEKRLQSAVEEGRKGNIALVSRVRP